MTTKELIAILEDMPQDATVDFSYRGNGTFHGTLVETESVSGVRLDGKEVVLKG